jgi:hypothetical protein
MAIEDVDSIPEDTDDFDTEWDAPGEDAEPEVDLEEEIPSEEDLTAEEAEAVEDVRSAKSKQDRQGRAQKRIHSLSTRAKEAAKLAQNERELRLAAEARLAEIQKNSVESTAGSLEAREKDVQVRIAKATREADMEAVVVAMAERQDIALERLKLNMGSPVTSPSKPSGDRTVHDELWLRENTGWDSTPAKARAVRTAWKAVAEAGVAPGTAEFYEALDAELESPKPARSKAPPLAGGASRSQPGRAGVKTIPREALAFAESLGMDIKDPEVRKQVMSVWSKK